MRISTLLLALTVLMAATPARAETTSRAEGDHFAVVLHFEADALAQKALEQLEQLWKPAATLYGLPLGAREEKLVVHLYRDEPAYQVAEEKITGGTFRKNLAFASFEHRTAHVALQPHVSEEVLARIGLPFLTRAMLLHEAAHLVRYDAMPNYRSHPGWLNDGAAMWLKYEVLGGADKDRVPLSATETVRVQALLEKDALPSSSRILDGGSDGLAFYDRYATRYLFFRFLRETHGDALRHILLRMRRLGGGSGFRGRLAALARECLGEKAVASLDEEFRAFVRALAPVWHESLRSLGPGSRDFVQCAFPKGNAVAWRTQDVDKPSYVFSATAEILSNVTHQMNILLDKSETGFVSIALTAGYGVTLFEHTYEGSRWRRVDRKKHPAVIVGKPFRLEARVTAKRLDVLVDGEVVLTASFPERALTGPWGLGVQAGSAGLWTDVAVK